MLGTTPTTINIMTCILTFNNPFYLFANGRSPLFHSLISTFLLPSSFYFLNLIYHLVNVSQHGMIYVSSNLTVNGTINGNGTVILYGGHLICDNLLIAKGTSPYPSSLPSLLLSPLSISFSSNIIVEYSNSVVITAQSRFSTSLVRRPLSPSPFPSPFLSFHFISSFSFSSSFIH